MHRYSQQHKDKHILSITDDPIDGWFWSIAIVGPDAKVIAASAMSLSRFSLFYCLLRERIGERITQNQESGFSRFAKNYT